jgi:hypothetical protein
LKPHPSATGTTKLLRFGSFEKGMPWTAITGKPRATTNADEKNLVIHSLPAMKPFTRVRFGPKADIVLGHAILLSCPATSANHTRGFAYRRPLNDHVCARGRDQSGANAARSLRERMPQRNPRRKWWRRHLQQLKLRCQGCPFQMSATAPITIASARLAIMTIASTRIIFARDITVRPSRREAMRVKICVTARLC